MQVFRAKREWLEACGKPTHENDFPVTRVLDPGNGLLVVHVETPRGPWVLIAPWRGELVDTEQLMREDAAH